MAEQQTAHFKNTYCTTTIAFYDLIIWFRRLETVPPPIVVIFEYLVVGQLVRQLVYRVFQIGFLLHFVHL